MSAGRPESYTVAAAWGVPSPISPRMAVTARNPGARDPGARNRRVGRLGRHVVLIAMAASLGRRVVLFRTFVEASKKTTR